MIIGKFEYKLEAGGWFRRGRRKRSRWDEIADPEVECLLYELKRSVSLNLVCAPVEESPTLGSVSG